MRSTGTDQLVLVWRLLAQGRDDEARARLTRTWAFCMDDLQSEQAGRVALRLFERAGFSTDDADGWERLPDPLTIHRAGDSGFSWTIDRETADNLAREHELSPVTTARVAKADVLAYITGRGEGEIVVRPEDVRRSEHELMHVRIGRKLVRVSELDRSWLTDDACELVRGDVLEQVASDPKPVAVGGWMLGLHFGEGMAYRVAKANGCRKRKRGPSLIERGKDLVALMVVYDLAREGRLFVKKRLGEYVFWVTPNRGEEL